MLYPRNGMSCIVYCPTKPSGPDWERVDVATTAIPGVHRENTNLVTEGGQHCPYKFRILFKNRQLKIVSVITYKLRQFQNGRLIRH
jgi:hypothetical protein